MIWEVRTGRQRFRLDGPCGIEAVSFSLDSCFLAFGDQEGAIRIMDVRTGDERACFHSEQGDIYALAFSEDGRTLASGGKDTTILLWSLPRSASARPSKRLSAEELRSLWTDLAGIDAGRALRAMRALYGDPDSAIRYFRAQLPPVRIADAGRVKRLLADLDADAFAVREEASRQLARIAEGAQPLLRQALREGASLEARRRIKGVLEPLAVESPEHWRSARALEVLEWLNTAESQRLLEEMSGGAAEAWLTRQAKESRDRLARR